MKTLLWIGESNRPVKRSREQDDVMDSAMNYYADTVPKLPYSPGRLFLDNGAFSATMTGKRLDPERVLSIQETLSPDLTIPLDYPITRHCRTVSQMDKLWSKTQQNFLFWQTSSKLTGRLVPALHAWNKKSLAKNLRWLQRHADSEFLALGSLIDGTQNGQSVAGYFGDREPKERTIEMILTAINATRKHTDFRIHFMGFGSSPLTLHLAYYLGVDSTDSSGHRRKAAFGKIVLRSTGERYLGDNLDVFGHGMALTNKRSSDIAELQRCDCEVCLTNRDLLWHDWRARAIHNEHVMKLESKIARILKGTGEEAYRSYLDLIFSSSSLNRIWKYARSRKPELNVN